MNKLTSNQLTSGLNTDINPKFQTDGTYRFALNAIQETKEGDYGTLSNEIGNSICAELPYGTRIIGHALTENEEILLFLFHRSVSNPPHEIGIYNPINCTYTTIAISSQFNFSDQHQINAFIRIRNGCERVVYFTDNYNPYRVANITDTSEWVTSGTTNVPDISKIKFSRDYIHPSVALDLVTTTDSTGNLQLGVYNFCMRYVDAEGNTTNWMEISRPVAIGNESFKLLNDTTTYPYYDGGSNSPADPGYIIPTNKAIGLQYLGLDTRFRYYQLAVIKRTSMEGVISGVDVLTKQPLTIANISLVYSGIDSQIDYQTSIEEILAETVIVDKVKAHAQLDSRLYVGNLTNTLVDYTGFQRHASRIKVEYVKTDASAVTKKAKRADYYFGNSTFLADEVYALGIVYVFKDGSISPVFHIPGRAPNSNVVGTHPHITGFTNWDTDNIPSDNNVYNIAKTKRWQVYNTSTSYVTPGGGIDVEGLMGYHETLTTYPTINNPCDTNPEGYWGVDVYGQPITPGVTKIRHHRMPSHEHQKAGLLAVVYKTGVKFTIVLGYPHPDIVGHYYVHSDRTYEKTILDKGIVCPVKYHSDPAKQELYAMWLTAKNGSTNVLVDINSSSTGANPNSTYTYISPKTTLEDSYAIGTYLRVERYISAAKDVATVTPTAERFDKVINVQSSASLVAEDYVTQAKFNYKIPWSAFLKKSYTDNAPGGFQSSGGASTVYVPIESKPVVNLSIHNNWLLIVPDTDLPLVPGPASLQPAKFLQVSLKSETDVFADLSQISYRRLDNAILKKVVGVNLVTTSFSGDTFISNFTPVDYAYARNGSGTVFVTGDTVHVPLESELAFEFRHGDNNSVGEYNYYRFNPDDPNPLIPFGEYLAERYYEPVIDSSSEFYEERYLLNKSFNYLDSINRYYPLPYDYEYCNDCLNDFPHRIYYSELDDAESSKDNFRIIRPLNYQDLPGITGEINDLFNNFSKLFAITDISPYHIPTRPQRLITDLSSVYIGTAEVFGIPPQQLKTTDYHFGGSRLFKARVSTEYGTFYIDDFTGRPFLLDNQLNDISLDGMRNFWQEQGPLKFEKQFFERAGVKYDNFSTSSDTGVGYITTYDPRFKRLIIHKRDFIYISHLPLIYQATKPTTECVWYNGKFFYYISGGSPSLQKIIGMEDPAYFENVSFTISYSFLTKSWISFHSYMPYYLFNNYLGYFSNTFEDDYIYKHLEGNHTEYYGEFKPHIVDLIAVNNPNMESQYTNLFYATSAQVIDIGTNQYKNVPTTFNEAIFYNSKQSSGKRPLQIKTDYFQFDYDPVTVLVDKVDNKYKVSNLRDLVINEDDPIWDSSWPTLQSSPFEYIDKVPNEANINYGASDFNRSRFRDYYLGLRLIHNPTDDIKLNTDIVNTMNSNRTR